MKIWRAEELMPGQDPPSGVYWVTSNSTHGFQGLDNKL